MELLQMKTVIPAHVLEEGERQTRARYYQNNKTKLNERHKDHYQNNKEYIKECNKQYNENNKETIGEQKKTILRKQ